MALGRTIRQLRQARGLTQAMLARRAGIAPSHIALLEGGHRGNPSLAVLRRLARALGVSIGKLVE
jgi:transcriptional regulator with XRE-family HTH domain